MMKIGGVTSGDVEVIDSLYPEIFFRQIANEKLEPAGDQIIAGLGLVYKYPNDEISFYVASALFFDRRKEEILTKTVAVLVDDVVVKIEEDEQRCIRNLRFNKYRGLISLQRELEEIRFLGITLPRCRRYRRILNKLLLYEPRKQELEELFTAAFINEEILRICVRIAKEELVGLSETIVDFSTHLNVPIPFKAIFCRVGTEVGITTEYPFELHNYNI